MTLTYRRDFLKLGAVAAAGTLLDSTSHGAWAGTLGGSTRGASLLPGGKGPRSGMPWFSGGFGNVTTFETWRGRPFDVYGSFLNYGTWANMTSFPSNTSFPSYVKKDLWISLGYPLLPKTLSGSEVFASFWDECAAATPVTAAARTFWQNHDRILTNTANCLKGTGVKCRGLILRVGWEFNGSPWPWKLATDYTKAPQYRDVFQRLVGMARDKMPNVVIEWNPLRKGTEGAAFSEIWPGDDYVDIVSICHYDRLPSFDSQEIWDAQAVRRYVKTKTTYTYEYNPVTKKNVKVPHVTTLWDNPWGIQTWADFAHDHGKLFAVPEWALSNGWNYTDNCKDRDNPLFIEFMMNFFYQNRDILAYESFFNSSAKHMIYPPGQVPYSAVLEVDGSNKACTSPSPNWPVNGTGRLTSVNDRASKRYQELVKYYYDLANPVG